MRIWLTAFLATGLLAAPPRQKAGLTYIYTYYDRQGGIVVNNLPPASVADRGYILKNVRVGKVRWALTSKERSRVIRSPELIAMVDEIAHAEGVDPHLARAIIQAESAFNHRAKSRVGALGLMQLMPATAERFGVLDPFDPKQNIQGGVKYLRWLMNHFQEDMEKVVAAYNAGENAVMKYRGIPPFRETLAYVPKVLNLWRNRSVQPDSRNAGAMDLLKKGKGGFLIEETPTRTEVHYTSEPSRSRLYAWKDAKGVINVTDHPPPAGFKEIKLGQD